MVEGSCATSPPQLATVFVYFCIFVFVFVPIKRRRTGRRQLCTISPLTLATVFVYFGILVLGYFGTD